MPSLFLCVDVTERKQRAEQLRRAARAEGLAELATGIGSDFSNLLRVISGYSEILMLRREGKSAPAEVNRIYSAAQQALFVCRQLSAFNPRRLVRPEPLNLNDMLLEMEAAVKRLAGERISVHMNPADYLPLVSADREQMGQLLLNLVISAYHTMSGTGDVLVEAQHSEDAPHSHRVIINARCSGHLGATADHARLIERFHSGMERGAAAGLALFTAHEIVRELGGSFNIMNHGWGTEFTVALPAASVAAELPARKTAEPRAGLKVLLVEDDSMVREFMRMALEENKFKVLEAESAARAFEIARDAGRIDLLITDLIMPDLPVLFVSGYPDDVLIGAGREEFSTSFLPKPFTMENLVYRVEEVLDAAMDPGPEINPDAFARSTISRSQIGDQPPLPTEESDPESAFAGKGTRFQIASRQVISFSEQEIHEQRGI